MSWDHRTPGRYLKYVWIPGTALPQFIRHRRRAPPLACRPRLAADYDRSGTSDQYESDLSLASNSEGLSRPCVWHKAFSLRRLSKQPHFEQTGKLTLLYSHHQTGQPECYLWKDHHQNQSQHMYANERQPPHNDIRHANPGWAHPLQDE